MTATSTRPPTHSPAMNCQPSSTYSTRPSSSTRLVEANRKASDGTSAAPFLNSVRVTEADA